MHQDNEIWKRYWSISRKVNSITTIRNLLTLDKSVDLTPRQWESVETLLFGIKEDLSQKLRPASRLVNFRDPASIKRISNVISETEMKLDKATKVFDLFLDIITQRQSKILGTMLGGCDVLAGAAIKQKHPILQITQTPIVLLQQGYGGAVLKENVHLYGYKNPTSLIQIPYSMLTTSYMLTTIPHEAGHVVMPRLEMDTVFPKMIFNLLEDSGAPAHVKDLFVLWNRELFADLWAFFCCGKAQCAIRDLLALPDEIVFEIRTSDPHPTNWIRALLSFEWCRQLWGHGKWDVWEEDWLKLYPLKLSKQRNVRTLEQLREFVPVFSKGIMKSVIPNLRVKLIDFFDMTNLSPNNLKMIADRPERFKIGLRNLNPCHQFSVFRHMYDENLITGRQCNRLVHTWLRKLNEYKATIFEL